MTQWVEETAGGRDRGPRGLARAAVEVLLRPERFFRTGVAPGDQAPGLVFAMVVVLVEELVRFALVADAYPVFGGRPVLSALFVLGAAVLVVTPAVLHLVGAAATVVLIALVEDRAGVSETVQVVAYAGAPCVLAGPAIPELRAACGLYAGALLVYGLAVVHGTTYLRAALAAAVPGVLAYGVGFRTIEAGGRLLRQWYII